MRLMNDRWVCANCFDDDDLKDLIRGGDEADCSYCGAEDVETIAFDDVAAHIKERLEEFYEKAANELPYESREGGYMARNWDTDELLFQVVGLDLPNDHQRVLARDLVDYIGDDLWCDYDWLDPEPDQSLLYSWERFAEVVKFERRFFFADHIQASSGLSSLNSFFSEVTRAINVLELFHMLEPSEGLYRARSRKLGEFHSTAATLGPPPAEKALQSNRMNPPGIPMFYGASSADLARTEVRSARCSVGRFETTRTTLVIDLASLPEPGGIFSTMPRYDVVWLTFFRQFAERIAAPVARDDRVHVDYLPTQVLAEYLRFYAWATPVEGIRYPTATGRPEVNIALFANQADCIDGSESDPKKAPWIKLASVEHDRPSLWQTIRSAIKQFW